MDDLQPLLTPYEAIFYWYGFRHSIVRNGNPYIRLSTRKLRGIVKSSYSTSKENTVSLGKVQEALRALEKFGAVRKEGEPSRDGTPYRIFVPDEIPACLEFRKSRTSSDPVTEVAAGAIDFYNIKENRRLVFERDNYICKYCKEQLTLFTATLDHLTPIAAGGDNSFENLITSCLPCNSRKNLRPVSDFLSDVASDQD